MENKIYDHVSRNRVSYLLAAALLMVGGLSLTYDGSVPNFYDLDNTVLTGNVGDLLNSNSPVSFLEQGLNSTVALTGETVTIQWQNKGNQPVSLYLIPQTEKNTGKPVKLGTVPTEAGKVTAYQWTVPPSTASGTYQFGISAPGGALAKTNDALTIVKVENAQDAGLAVQNQLAAVQAEIQKAQSELVKINAQMTNKKANITQQETQLKGLQEKVSATSTRYYRIKVSNPATQQQVDKELSTLNNQVSQATVSLQEAKADLAAMEAKAKTLEAMISKRNISVTALGQKMNQLKGLSVNGGMATMGAVNMNLASNGFNLEAQQASLNEMKAQIQAKQAAVSNLKAELENYAKELEVSNAEIAKHQAALGVSLKKVQEFTTSLSEVQKKAGDVTAQLRVTQDAAQKAELEKQLAAAQQEVSKSQELLIAAQSEVEIAQRRLSSGLKINKASDDAASATEEQVKMLEAELSSLNTQVSLLESEIALSEAQMQSNRATEMPSLDLSAGSDTSSMDQSQGLDVTNATESETRTSAGDSGASLSSSGGQTETRATSATSVSAQ